MVVPSPPFPPGSPMQPGPEMLATPKDALRNVSFDSGGISGLGPGGKGGDGTTMAVCPKIL